MPRTCTTYFLRRKTVTVKLRVIYSLVVSLSSKHPGVPGALSAARKLKQEQKEIDQEAVGFSLSRPERGENTRRIATQAWMKSPPPFQWGKKMLILVERVHCWFGEGMVLFLILSWPAKIVVGRMQTCICDTRIPEFWPRVHFRPHFQKFHIRKKINASNSNNKGSYISHEQEIRRL